jgi:DNA primase catalytic core
MTETEFRDFVENVRDRTDIIKVVESRGIELNSSNMALCPFHEDSKPSLSVHAEKQYFNCFGCSARGDVFRFLELYESRPFWDVLTELAREAGVEVPSITDKEKQATDHRRKIEEVLTETIAFYEQKLTPEAMSYLINDRGLTADTIKNQRIGYAPGGLADHLLGEKGFPENLCLRAGVLKGDKNGRIQDFFFKRIVFPWIRFGQVVHMTGRRIDGQDPKYLNLPGSIEALYNESAFRNSEVIVTEGILDSLAASQWDFAAVALHGLVFKPQFVSKCSHCDTVYLCLDSDGAGKRATLKIADLLGEKARIIALPDGQDLNDYAQAHNKDELQALMEEAKTPLAFALEQIPANTQKIDLPKRLEPVLERLAKLDEPTAEAWLSHNVKDRFQLKGEEIKEYRRQVKAIRQSQRTQTLKKKEVDGKAERCAVFDGLVDIVEHKGQPAYLIKDREGPKIMEEVLVDGKKYLPPRPDKIPWLLSRGTKVLEFFEYSNVLEAEADAALYDDLRAYLEKVSELPEAGLYDLLTAWIMHTYLLEAVQYSPIICLFAVPERGKSRTGMAMIHLAYRGFHVESLREAYLIRMSENWTASIFFDVKNIWKKAERSNSEDVLLHRYERAAKVARVIYPERGPHEDTVYYDIFGPTIIATNEAIDKILETRAITIRMPETQKEFEMRVTPENARELKERLVSFRLRHLGSELPRATKPAPSRLGDILLPLLQIMRLVRPSREEAFLDVVQKLLEERLIDKSVSLEAEILKAVVQLTSQVSGPYIKVSDITFEVNRTKREREQLKSNTVGRKLSALGFRKSRTGKTGSFAIILNDKELARLCRTYGVEGPSETSESSENQEQGSEVSEQTELFPDENQGAF